jgi:glycerate kinase
MGRRDGRPEEGQVAKLMRILVAPDKFKGSITAAAAAEAIANGMGEVMPQAVFTLAPIADGGEGFAEAMCMALGGTWIERMAKDPLEREVHCRYAWIEREKLAVIEMAEASGLWRLIPEERAPLRAHTFGTGQLIRDAAERGARRILVGLGGSATTDGGAGMAAALGYDLLTSDGDDLDPYPGDLIALVRIDDSNAIELPEIIAACDVQNPLLGERGTARVFSPQKGADEKTVVHLEASMRQLAEIVTESLGCDYKDAAGAGAAGGIGFGLMSFCAAQVRSGFDLLAETIGLEEKIAASDLVVTGEGRLDAQTLEGKGPAGVAQLARKHGKPVLAFGGGVDEAAEKLFDATVPIIDSPLPLAEAIRRGAELLHRAARRAGRLLALSHSK